MIGDTLRKLDERIRGATGASEETRGELLALLDELRGELATLEETHASDAESIANRAWAVADGAAQDVTGADETESVVRDLEEALTEFELTHPRLQGVLRSFFKTLGDAGI